MISKILVAIDQSENSQQVLTEAIALAKATDAFLMLVSVLSPFDTVYAGTPLFPGSDGVYPGMHTAALRNQMSRIEELEQNGAKFLGTQTEKAIAEGVMADFTQGYGDPGATICDLARTWEADLIVVGRRGLTGLSEFLMGSVSNYVLHHAPCAVLTVQNAKTSAVKTVGKEKSIAV